MHKAIKLIAIVSIASSGVLGLSACTGATKAVTTIGSQQPPGQAAKQIDTARKTVVGENIANTVTQLETAYAATAVYAPLDKNTDGTKVITSDQGYIVSGSTPQGETAYRVSGSTELYWFAAPIKSLDQLTKAGATIPVGITTLPQ
jgi:hypothetical protein